MSGGTGKRTDLALRVHGSRLRGSTLLCLVLLVCGAIRASSQRPDYPDLIFLRSVVRPVSRRAKIVKASPDAGIKQDNVAADRWRRFRAFTILDSTRSVRKYPDRIFFTDARTHQTFEILSLPEPHRPYDNLTFEGGILQFDRWASPHHGVRYRLDVRRRKIIFARAFIEADYVERQRKS